MELVLVAAGFWAVFVWQAVHINWRKWDARFSLWSVLALAVLFTTRAAADSLDRAVNLPGAGVLLEYTALLLFSVIWGYLCLRLLPPLKSQRWILWAAVLCWGALLGVWLMEAGWGVPAGVPPQTERFEWAMTLISHAYFLDVLIALGLPATLAQVRCEGNGAVRMRLRALSLSQAITSLIVGLEVIQKSLLILNVVSYDYLDNIFLNPLLALDFMVFLAVYAPSGFYARMEAQRTNLARLWQACVLYWLYRRSVALLPPVRIALELDWRQLDLALYELVIAVLDQQKLLAAQPSPGAHQLAERIGRATRQADDYLHLVDLLTQAAF